MPIDYRIDGEDLREILAHRADPARPIVEQMQVKVSCQGDIAVQPFYPEDCDGVAWLLLAQGPAGEPGRDINGEVDEGPRRLQTQPGILIGADDPRSLDTIIRVATALRDRLRARRGNPMQDLYDDEDQRFLRDVDKAINLYKDRGDT